MPDTKNEVQVGQVWLASLSYGPNNPVHLAVVKITGSPSHNDDKILFRNLECEEPFQTEDADAMYRFALLSLVKD